MEALEIVLVLLAAVVVSGALARASKAPLPVAQILVGAAIALSPARTVRLDPELFFVLFLPPLLFLDGWRMPKDELRRNRAVISELAIGLVVLTVVVVGFVIHAMIPAMPLPVAFALAAIISPTDPVAVAEVAKRAPMPRRMMHILEGEALLNDASGLVCMRFAVAAALTSRFSLTDAVGAFAWLAIAGAATGVVVSLIIGRLNALANARLGEDVGAQILISLLVPYAAYIAAELIHASGILAAAAAGISMSISDLSRGSAAARLRGAVVWDTLRLAANGAIFVLLGEQLPDILSQAPEIAREAGRAEPWRLALDVMAIVAAVAAVRFAWVWVSLNLTLFRVRRSGTGGGLSPRPQPPPRRRGRLVLAMSFAGVRGAVTLAGILTLPETLRDGTPFPARDLAIFLAAGVILTSLAGAILVLPMVLNHLEMPPEPSHEAAVDEVRARAARAAIQAIEARRQALADGRDDADLYAEAASRAMDVFRQAAHPRSADPENARMNARLEHVQRELRLTGLKAERIEILAAMRRAAIGAEAGRALIRELDLIEARYSG